MDKILDPDSKGPLLVVPWLVGANHSCHERGRDVKPARDGLGTLVDVEGCSDTVPSAMSIVQALLPEVDTS